MLKICTTLYEYYYSKNLSLKTNNLIRAFVAKVNGTKDHSHWSIDYSRLVNVAIRHTNIAVTKRFTVVSSQFTDFWKCADVVAIRNSNIAVLERYTVVSSQFTDFWECANVRIWRCVALRNTNIAVLKRFTVVGSQFTDFWYVRIWKLGNLRELCEKSWRT